MFYKIGIPKYSEVGNGGALKKMRFLNTFCYRTPLLAASQYFAKFMRKHLCESAYFIKF